ncbi:MAG: hypothetical protein [Caudoviricetes sp.]|nr:MAG: hypothetical protein [Caudoviricetes sp.]
MKPSWDDAPEWAEWLAGDTQGFVWSKGEPEFLDGMWADDETDLFQSFGEHDPKREVFKERRP